MLQKKQYNNIHIMGVINITPNSFSDGGKFNSEKKFLKHLQYLVNCGVNVFDIGAESTAPFNDPISENEEIERFKNIFFANISHFPDNAIFSIDTYRGETFVQVYQKIKELRPSAEIWWNDISGVLDDSIGAVLDECADSRYVFCHTLTPTRAASSRHMDFILDCNAGDEASELIKRFKYAIQFFQDKDLDDRLILDPCFGFSKTFEQNLRLLGELPTIISSFDSSIEWVVGISRKSFFKKSIDLPLDNAGAVEQIERLHSAYLCALFLKVKKGNLFIRVHDPSVVKNALFISKLF